MAEEHKDVSVRERERQELEQAPEKTVPGRYFVPDTDIVETDDALILVMDMPGVSRERVSIDLDQNVLTVEGRIDTDAYRELRPVYTEYSLGHFSRRFSISEDIDDSGITARINDGVLTLRLPKSEARKPRRIEVA